MGMSMITAMEIFTNPHDLEIIIGQEKSGGKFAIGIFRGPGHSYRPLVTSHMCAETVKDAVETVQGILEMIEQVMAKEVLNRDSVAFQYLNPEGQEIDQSKVLNPDLIGSIVRELEQHQKASTYKMFAPTN